MDKLKDCEKDEKKYFTNFVLKICIELQTQISLVTIQGVKHNNCLRYDRLTEHLYTKLYTWEKLHQELNKNLNLNCGK